MKVSDYITSFLEAHGIEYVFGYQGGMITHLVDSLSKNKTVKFVQCYHEQSAAFAAEGYARATGKFGVCITTSGPGATNIVTSVANAYFDSIPILYITGQVNTYEYKYDSPIRQKGFQETDIVAVVEPVSKYARLCDDPSGLPKELDNAVSAMLAGRRGPVLLDMPMNVQRAEVQLGGVDIGGETPAGVSGRMDPCLQIAIDALAAAKRPLIVCGGGLADYKTNIAAREFVKSSSCPYVVSLMGKGLVDETDRFCVGMIGSYGNRCANMALAEADVVLALGSRLDLRQTGNRNSPLLKDKLFIRVDVDRNELQEFKLPKQIPVNCDVVRFCSDFAALGGEITACEEWRSRIRAMKYAYAQMDDVRRYAKNQLPYDILKFVSARAADDTLFVVDIGQNQMWAAQTIRCREKQRFFTSGGMAPMGYAIPAAAGAAFANPGRQIVCICGDGGLHISVQSLMLISQYRLPVSVIVFNNHALGMITQFQSLYFNGNFAGTTADGGYCVPDLKHLALAYGLPYRKISSPGEFLPEMLVGPTLVEVQLDGLTTVVPKLQFNHDLDNMTPSYRIDE